jgi:hypothetical protein
MENLFQHIAPALEQIGPVVNGVSVAGVSAGASTTDSASHLPVSKSTMAKERKEAGSPATSSSGSASGRSIKVEDEFSESFGQLALDDHGHMRWIGGSSTMSLIQSFRALTTSPMHRVSPMEEDPRAPGPSVNKLYFPASVFFGKVHALPGPEEAEYPERDLADKLVSRQLVYHLSATHLRSARWMHTFPAFISCCLYSTSRHSYSSIRT